MIVTPPFFSRFLGRVSLILRDSLGGKQSGYPGLPTRDAVFDPAKEQNAPTIAFGSNFRFCGLQMQKA
jgi:hypothetical protein